MVPNPIDVAEELMQSRGWSSRKADDFLVAQVHIANWQLEIGFEHLSEEGLLRVHCCYLSWKKRRRKDTVVLIASLIMELNEKLPFGSFTFNRVTRELGFTHTLFVAGVREDLMEANIDFVLAAGMEICAMCSPLFERIMKNGSYPERRIINFAISRPEGEA